MFRIGDKVKYKKFNVTGIVVALHKRDAKYYLIDTYTSEYSKCWEHEDDIELVKN